METKLNLSFVVTLGINPNISDYERGKVIQVLTNNMFDYAKKAIENNIHNVIQVDQFQVKAD